MAEKYVFHFKCELDEDKEQEIQKEIQRVLGKNNALVCFGNVDLNIYKINTKGELTKQVSLKDDAISRTHY